MPRDIKLDCYHFTFKKETVQDFFTFQDFFESFDPTNEQLTMESRYNSFHGDLLNYFGSQFRINKSETKGITLRSEDKFETDTEGFIVSGFLSGGDTGIGKNIQERNDSASGDPVDRYKIHSIPHYFLMWMPSDLNFCIVLVQSYTGESLSGMFLQHLENYFSSKRIKTFNRRKFLPKRLVDDFRNNAKVSSVTFKSSSIARPKRQALNPVLVEKERLTVDMKFKGFGSDTYWSQIGNWLNNRPSELLGVDLSSVSLDNPTDVVVEYTYHGKKCSGKLTNEFQIIPSLTLTDIQRNHEEHPIFESIDEYARDFLIELIDEAGYSHRNG